MKRAILIIFLFSALTLKAQYRVNNNHMWKQPKLYIPATTLGMAFTVNQAFGGDMNYTERTAIALTGIASSVILYLVIKETKRKHRGYR